MSSKTSVSEPTIGAQTNWSWIHLELLTVNYSSYPLNFNSLELKIFYK